MIPLLRLAILHFANQGVRALPLAAVNPSSGSKPTRTKYDIIRSCILTIFACTWVSVHPNIPRRGRDLKWYSTTVHRVRLTVLALVAPELILAWAMREWIVAYKLGKEYREYGWTQAHGHFAIMGGFVLFRGNTMLRPIHPNELRPYLQSGEINITDEEIRDKGRSDMLSKALVVVQTTWFLLQCLARRAEGLPITELELVTIAFSALNFVTYTLWWNKPKNVGCPVRVRRSEQGGDGEVDLEGIGDKGINVSRPDHSRVGASVRGIVAMLSGWYPTFDTTKLTRGQKWLAGFGLVIATIFGAIHCAGWSFMFPSRTEQLLWRVSAIAISGLPLFAIASTRICVDMHEMLVPDHRAQLLAAGFVLMGFLCTAAYIMARVTLLVLPFIALRSLTPEVYQTVQWTTFIPHL